VQPTDSPQKCLLVIFGASGDLTQRKLIPSLYALCRAQKLPRHMAVLGVSRTKMSDQAFRDRMKASCQADEQFDQTTWQRFADRLHYEPNDAADMDQLEPLVQRIRRISDEHQTQDNLLFYLSVAPKLYEPIVTNLGQSGLITEGKRWCSLNRQTAPWQRIIVEKPFGYDLASAAHLNRVLGRVFEDESIYRIDHYLGKETVQNLLVFRFANLIFEPLWNRNYVDHVQITAAETVGVEDRAGYFDKAGVLRDMVQSHLLQLMAIVAMEAPNSFKAEDLRTEQRKVLDAVSPIDPKQVDDLAVRGQYGPGRIDDHSAPGYRGEADVPADSVTDTFAALRLHIDNWRWHGVPFALRSGKRMRRKLTQIVVQFKPTPHCMFSGMAAGSCPKANRLVINVQPDEGINLRFEGKVPGAGMKIQSVVMDFDWVEQLGGEVPEAYATLLLDAMRGDQSQFKDRREIEAAWRIVKPVLERWSAQAPGDFPNYPAGSWGPDIAEKLLADHGGWRNPEGPSSRSKMIP
jgi:glucose-6-phosphate 1-dehydrogenase